MQTRDLPGGQVVQLGRLPAELLPGAAGMDALWQLHPAAYHVISMHGRQVSCSTGTTPTTRTTSASTATRSRA